MKSRFLRTTAMVAAICCMLTSSVFAQWAVPPGMVAGGGGYGPMYGPGAGYASMTPGGVPIQPTAGILMGDGGGAGCEVGCTSNGSCGCTDKAGCGGGSACGNGGNCGNGCICGDECCPAGGWCHRIGFFGEFLYLRPRNAEVAYAVEINSDEGDPVVQVGPVGVLDMEYQPAFRGGFEIVLDPSSSITAQYTHFEGDVYDRTDRSSPITQVDSLLYSPKTLNTSDRGVYVDGQYDLQFNLIDVDYRELFSYGCYHQLNFLVGARYANLDQQVLSLIFLNGVDGVLSAVDFDGAGLRLGLEGVRYSRRGLYAYGKSHTSLVAGEFRARYDQGNVFDLSEVHTSWKAGRIVPILDLEVGVGYATANGCWRFSGGYMYSAWFNTVKIDEWVNAVQANNYVGLGDGLTFDGLVLRAETRF